MKKLILLAFVLLAVPQGSGNPREITVRLYWLQSPSELELSAAGADGELRRCETCPWEPVKGTLTLRGEGSRLFISGRENAIRRLEVRGEYELRTPQHEPLRLDAPLRVNATGGYLSLVVSLPLETYVAGVLAGEAGGVREGEALKAMAISARTYAARFRGRHNSEGFDFCDTTHCQDIRIAGVTDRLRIATRDTEGELLWYEGRPAATFYHRNCGGTTEDVTRVWRGLEAPYLRQQSDPYCVVRDRGDWHASISAEALSGALQRGGIRVNGSVSSVDVLERTPSGRVARLGLEGAQPRDVEAEKLRRAVGQSLGWHLIRSDFYQVRRTGDEFFFEGYGSGHGVGLCQVGAQQMAADDHAYQAILKFYYPGTRLGLTAAAPAWSALSGERVEILTTDIEGERGILSVADRAAQRAEAEIGWRFPQRPQLRIFPSIELFRNVTGEPGWVAASTRGHIVRLQPPHNLERFGRLDETLYHELLHMLIDSQMQPGLPLWFREGLVLYLTGAAVPPGARPTIDIETLEHQLHSSRNQAEMRRAYRASHRMVAALVDAHGRQAVLGWVGEGLPEVLFDIR